MKMTALPTTTGSPPTLDPANVFRRIAEQNRDREGPGSPWQRIIESETFDEFCTLGGVLRLMIFRDLWKILRDHHDIEQDHEIRLRLLEAYLGIPD